VCFMAFSSLPFQIQKRGGVFICLRGSVFVLLSDAF